jgi:hypothetical protein
MKENLHCLIDVFLLVKQDDDLRERADHDKIICLVQRQISDFKRVGGFSHQQWCSEAATWPLPLDAASISSTVTFSFRYLLPCVKSTHVGYWDVALAVVA